MGNNRNDYLDFYGEHHISPVKQNISDINVHYERRTKLYRQCGIPTLVFRNAEILEVGPGGGYNTLAFFLWGSKHVDLVEPNQSGREDMQKLFAEKNIPCEKYDIFSCQIEDYQTDKQYDIIIAEGFLANIYNQQEVIHKLQSLQQKKGIIVITCIDHVGLFVESIKRLISIALTADIQDYNQKVYYLADLFSPQLATLRGVSRSAEEWVQDQILNPTNANGTELTLSQAIDYFGEAYDVLGSSPHMFTDYSWYKDIWYDYKQSYKNQFNQKRLSFMLANMPELILPAEKSNALVMHFENIKKFESQYEKSLNIAEINNIIKEIDDMEELAKESFNDMFLDVLYEIREILLKLQKGEKIDMNNFSSFFSAFGRTQQYISFVKK